MLRFQSGPGWAENRLWACGQTQYLAALAADGAFGCGGRLGLKLKWEAGQSRQWGVEDEPVRSGEGCSQKQAAVHALPELWRRRILFSFIVHSLQCVLRLGFCMGECVAISRPLILL